MGTKSRLDDRAASSPARGRLIDGALGEHPAHVARRGP
jgi:hypothetical protein